MSGTIKGPAYRIHTARLVLRCWEPSDAAALKQTVDNNLEHLRPFMPWAHHEPTSLETRIEWLRGCRARFDTDQDYIYGVFSRDGSQVLGGTGLHTRLGEGALEIGYWIDQDHTRQGLATELSAALTRVAFTVHGVQRVEIHCDIENIASAAVPQKLGYTHEATLLRRMPRPEGGFGDLMIWRLFAEDYPKTPSYRIEIEAFDAIGRKLL
jgi:RimJ/RimL family protein N-acetyltransferase